MPYPLHLNIPADNDNRGDVVDIYSFRNSLPQDGLQAYQTEKQKDSTSDGSTASLHRKSVVGSLFWPVIAITLPIALVSASLLALVLGYEVKSERSLFQPVNASGSRQDNLYILVNYSATRIVFAASFLSTLAPILGSFIMTLWSLPTAQMMRAASTSNELLHLPTPYQLSLIVGITLASVDRLRAYFIYLFSRSRRAAMPPVLNRAAMMLSFSILLACAVFLTDTALHYTTTTIEFDQISPPSEPVLQSGRGLSPACIDFDRLANRGLPCSYDTAQMYNDPVGYLTEHNEIYLLSQNISTNSEIRFVPNNQLKNSDLALLIPKSETMDVKMDYKASTIAISTECSFATEQCGLKSINTTTTDYVTQFNCTDNFFGLLGLDPVASDSDGRVDPNISPLAFKPAKNLDYAFFQDAKLSQLYNPVGYDTTLNASLQHSGFVPHPLADNTLRNPIHLGLAGRFQYAAQAANTPLYSQPTFYSPDLPGTFVDFVLTCSIHSYDAEYEWVNGNIEGISFSPSPNGSVLEIFHGNQLYAGVGNSGYDLQNYLSMAALAEDPEAFAKTWADLYSLKVLSGIGAYTTPRKNLQEQVRTTLLVARVPKPALGALVACSLIYTILGVCLGISAYKASAKDIRDLAAQLSLAGLTTAAFDEKPSSTLQSSIPSVISYEEQRSKAETRRVVVDGDPATGYDFRVWV